MHSGQQRSKLVNHCNKAVMSTVHLLG